MIPHSLLRCIPTSVIRYLGRLQFRAPALRGMIKWVGETVAWSEGVILRGEGAGLRFRAAGGFPGYLLGTSEPEEQALLAKHLEEGAIFYDVGANIGFYSTMAGRMVGARGKVFAFEPFPKSADACRYNASINHFDNVSVIECAVTSQSGMATLEVGKESATHRLGSGTGMQVPLISIDDWRKETGAPPPDVVMVDIEGAELEALKGMKHTIMESHPTILVEVHWLGEPFVKYVHAELAPLGYRATTYQGNDLPSENVRYHALLQSSRRVKVNHPS